MRTEPEDLSQSSNTDHAIRHGGGGGGNDCTYAIRQGSLDVVGVIVDEHSGTASDFSSVHLEGTLHQIARGNQAILYYTFDKYSAADAMWLCFPSLHPPPS